MKKRNSILVAFLAFSLTFTLAFAAHHTAKRGGKLISITPHLPTAQNLAVHVTLMVSDLKTQGQKLTFQLWAASRQALKMLLMSVLLMQIGDRPLM